jgi:hypothetical protein
MKGERRKQERAEAEKKSMGLEATAANHIQM